MAVTLATLRRIRIECFSYPPATKGVMESLGRSNTRILSLWMVIVGPVLRDKCRGCYCERSNVFSSHQRRACNSAGTRNLNRRRVGIALLVHQVSRSQNHGFYQAAFFQQPFCHFVVSKHEGMNGVCNHRDNVPGAIPHTHVRNSNEPYARNVDFFRFQALRLGHGRDSCLATKLLAFGVSQRFSSRCIIDVIRMPSVFAPVADVGLQQPDKGSRKDVVPEMRAADGSNATYDGSAILDGVFQSFVDVREPIVVILDVVAVVQGRRFGSFFPQTVLFGVLLHKARKFLWWHQVAFDDGKFGTSRVVVSFRNDGHKFVFVQDFRGLVETSNKGHDLHVDVSHFHQLAYDVSSDSPGSSQHHNLWLFGNGFWSQEIKRGFGRRIHERSPSYFSLFLLLWSHVIVGRTMIINSTRGLYPPMILATSSEKQCRRDSLGSTVAATRWSVQSNAFSNE
mmetsp:Transcript_13542/g.38103  ORF Transcript_13542/g.38103 Transcript_13542/m.38103 type:complete len:452 (+) Transcript_13542:3856-5211(+)